MSIENALTRRQIFVQRFSGSEALKAERQLARIYGEITARLSREPTQFQADRLIKIRQDLSIIMAQGFDALNTNITESVLGYTADETNFAFRALGLETNAILSLPAVAGVERAVLQFGLDTPIGPGTITMQESLLQFTKNKSREIQLAIGDGILLGETTPQITKRVGELAVGRPKHQVNALVRTLINHAASMARSAVANQNSELLSGEEWVATLDSRTTLICAGRDGRIYPVGKGPQTPAHWGCRSLRIPVLKPEFDVQDDKATRAQKGEKKGQVSSKTKFDGWLRGQSAEFQDEYFSQFPDGAEKAALFRRGKLPIQAFRDETGRDFTLEQLRGLEPLAFDKANLDMSI